MSFLRRLGRCVRGQALVEFTLILPFLIALGLAVIEFGNVINDYMVLYHLTREAANLVSREPYIKGTSQWATQVNADMSMLINSAAPVLRSNNQPQWRVTYSMIVWDGTKNCGVLSNGVTIDNFVIERGSSAPGWVNPTWSYGSLGPANNSNIGVDGACAAVTLPSMKNITAGETLHVIEAFYDYGPNRLTPVANFIGSVLPGVFYTRSVFMDVPG